MHKKNVLLFCKDMIFYCFYNVFYGYFIDMQTYVKTINKKLTISFHTLAIAESLSNYIRFLSS